MNKQATSIDEHLNNEVELTDSADTDKNSTQVSEQNSVKGEQDNSGEVENQSSLSPADYEIKITQLEEQLKQAEEKTIRALAEMENTKRRSQKEVEKATKFAIENLIKELLPVLDGFDSGKQSIPDEQTNIIQGIKMLEDSFVQVLQKFGVEIILPNEGDDFNPDEHQAIKMQDSSDYEKNKIVNIFQRGFSIKGRLIRPAMVIVSS